MTGHGFTLSERPFSSTATLPLHSNTTPHSNGWLAFDLHAALKGWLKNSHENVTVEVACPTCNRAKRFPATGTTLQPLLQMATRARRKTKRASRWCGREETRCCLQPLYVSFVDFGWKWILEPAGFWANYCRALSTPVHPHSRLMANTRHGMEVLTCCTPAKLTGLSILYVNTHGLIIKSNLPNMVVGSCGCA